jgi:hypothetical protein
MDGGKIDWGAEMQTRDVKLAALRAENERLREALEQLLLANKNNPIGDASDDVLEAEHKAWEALKETK